jgi:N-acetylglutamate synthase-like GNAT family acetyltransferase
MCINIERAKREDLEEILALQYVAYQSEAKLVNNYSIQPLTETIEKIIDEYKNGMIYKALKDDGTIVGSVRGYIDGGILNIGKLMVHPDYQGNEIGTKLLKYIEKENLNFRKELFTSEKSVNNLKL